MNLTKIDIKRKPNFSGAFRNIDATNICQVYGDIVVEASNDKIKQALLLIKTDQSYEKNSKAIGNTEISTLRETLEYLRDGEGLNSYQYAIQDYLKPGLIFEILSTISRLLPSRCGNCQKEVLSNERLKTHQCIACGM